MLIGSLANKGGIVFARIIPVRAQNIPLFQHNIPQVFQCTHAAIPRRWNIFG
jgi:hypothetical protein